jgi:amino acid transporter
LVSPLVFPSLLLSLDIATSHALAILTIYTAPVSFFSWKLIKRTRLLKATEVDLVWERPTIDAYELTFMDPPNSFWGEMLGPLKFGKMKKSSDRQMSVGGV